MLHVGKLAVLEDMVKFNAQTIMPPYFLKNEHDVGRELFRVFRQSVNRADQGASVIIA
ncbi:hypothetical protein MCW_00809 [Cardidatus Bartonella washoeensis 085-0475]|uniref:Uncharacterized protein n=1 Tax=Cardidatus Bartonella washoeensis 085-0475 TaxID=1094564 RepID=J1JM77_9HYPH|nr:hypothetical protein MCW_00809 [Bartonella washoeensis 085-0475]